MPLLSFFFQYIPPAAAAAAAKLLQSCPTLCDPIDGGPPGSAVPGILQARTLEWVAISFSNAWKGKVKVKSLSRVRLLVTPWTAAYQAPPSMGFSRQEYLLSPKCLHTLHYPDLFWKAVSHFNSLLNFFAWISALPSNPIPTDPYHFIDISLMKFTTFYLYNLLFLFYLPDETVRSLKSESIFSSSYALNKLIVTSCIE